MRTSQMTLHPSIDFAFLLVIGQHPKFLRTDVLQQMFVVADFPLPGSCVHTVCVYAWIYPESGRKGV